METACRGFLLASLGLAGLPRTWQAAQLCAGGPARCFQGSQQRTSPPRSAARVRYCSRMFLTGTAPATWLSSVWHECVAYGMSELI